MGPLEPTTKTAHSPSVIHISHARRDISAVGKPRQVGRDYVDCLSLDRVVAIQEQEPIVLGQRNGLIEPSGATQISAVCKYAHSGPQFLRDCAQDFGGAEIRIVIRDYPFDWGGRRGAYETQNRGGTAAEILVVLI